MPGYCEDLGARHGSAGPPCGCIAAALLLAQLRKGEGTQ